MEDAAFSTQDSILSTGIRSAVCAPLLVHLRHRRARTRSSASCTSTRCMRVAPLHRGGPARRHRPRQPGRGQDRERAPAGGEPREAPPGGRHAGGGGDPARPAARQGARGRRLRRRRLEHALPHRWAATTTTSPSTTGGCCFALGDVSGKGTGAALLMTVLRAAVRGHWAEGSVEEAVVPHQQHGLPERHRRQVHHLLRGPPRSRQRARSDYVNAGHNPPVLVRRERRRSRPSPAAAWCWACSIPSPTRRARR